MLKIADALQQWSFDEYDEMMISEDYIGCTWGTDFSSEREWESVQTRDHDPKVIMP